MGHPIIRIENLRLSAGGQAIVKTGMVSISEKRVAIVGRNGSGKTSLSRVICGLVKPDQGRVTIDGNDIYQDRKAAIRKIGVLFQNPDHQIIYPLVGEEMDFGLRQLGLDSNTAREKTQAMLERFGKPDWINRQTNALSQGQKQLLCLMSVLVMQPEILMLDEPLSGLDIPTQRALMGILNRLDQTILHITHDPKIIETSDRVIWVEQGQIHLDGPPADVLPAFLQEMEKPSEI